MARRKNLAEDHDELFRYMATIPSDFESDTDESFEDEGNANWTCDHLTSAQDDTDLQESTEGQEDCVIIIGEENNDTITAPSTSTEIIQEVNTSTNKDVRRRWRKKEEPMMNTNFVEDTNLRQFEPETPLDSFLYYFDAELLERMTYETNLKSVQNGKESRISKKEIISILGMNMIMSYHQLPSYRNYWSGSNDLEVRIIKNTMTRERFKLIMSNLHLMTTKRSIKIIQINCIKSDQSSIISTQNLLRNHMLNTWQLMSQ